MVLRRMSIWVLILTGFFGNVRGNVVSDSLLIVRSIDISGNRITRGPIILRELTFAEGDTVPANELPEIFARSEDNLMNTSLFNFVTLSNDTEGNDLKVHIEVTERWYIWPIPIFEHAERNLPSWLRNPEFSKLNYGVQVNWNNFRGRRELIELKLRFGYKEQYAFSILYPGSEKSSSTG